MKKAVVTGAAGFIGKFLVRELLNQNVDVIAVVRPDSKNIMNIPPNVQTVKCSLEEISQLSQLIPDRDIDAVFHAAWQGVSDSDARNEDVQIRNIVSVLKLIDVMHDMGIRTFVGCGSVHETEAMVEMAEHKPVTNLGLFYKTAKTSAHWMGKAKAGSYGIRFFWPLINTYGEEENSARLINTVIRKIFNGESPDLSAGNQIYDFVHVCDVARALFLISERGINGTNYVIGSGDAKPLKEFMEIAGSIANKMNGSNIPLGFGKITENVISLPPESFHIDHLKRDTGFCPQISFEEGIYRTAQWIMRNQ